MKKILNPAELAPPAARYAHAVLVTEPRRWLHTSGVVPVSPDGAVPIGLVAQAALVWANIAVLLNNADMDASNIVSVTTYVVAAESANLAHAMSARDAFLAGQLSASTLLIVPALAQPTWLIEIAIVAAA